MTLIFDSVRPEPPEVFRQFGAAAMALLFKEKVLTG